MLAAKLHQLLRFWMLRVPSHSIPKMPLFSPLDVPLIIGMTPRVWWHTVYSLHRMRRNLTEQAWPGLHIIYPRMLMAIYVYLEFVVARYCGFFKVLIKQPDRAIIAEVFLRYVCTIDLMIDASGDMQQWAAGYSVLRRIPGVKTLASELCSRIAQLETTPTVRIKMLRLIVSYRRNASRALMQWIHSPSLDIDKVIRHKECTTGMLWATWCQLLTTAYNVPDTMSIHSSTCLFSAGMILQVIDDLGDVPIDQAGGAENLFLALAEQDQTEKRVLKRHLDQSSNLFLDWGWARMSLPSTLAKANALIERYAQNLHSDIGNPPIAHELETMLNRMQRMGA